MEAAPANLAEDVNLPRQQRCHLPGFDVESAMPFIAVIYGHKDEVCLLSR